jgi:hypothetical protein
MSTVLRAPGPTCGHATDFLSSLAELLGVLRAHLFSRCLCGLSGSWLCGGPNCKSNHHGATENTKVAPRNPPEILIRYSSFITQGNPGKMAIHLVNLRGCLLQDSILMMTLRAR